MCLKPIKLYCMHVHVHIKSGNLHGHTVIIAATFNANPVTLTPPIPILISHTKLTPVNQFY